MSNIQKTLILGFAIAAASAGAGCGGKQDAAPQAATDSLVVPSRDQAFLTATQHYGDLYVSEGSFLDEADKRPWSSYWYPVIDDILVSPSTRNGGQCTLDKYDKYSKASGKVSTSIDEAIRIGDYSDSAPLWEGRCNAWAAASVMEEEPALPDAGVTVQGQTFYTRDVKALLVMSYEVVKAGSFQQYGQRFNGQPEDEFDDIYPDQFHRVLQAEIFARHRPFLMDEDAGIQVWNTPVWKAQTTLLRDASDPHVMHVETSVVGAKSIGVSPDYAGPGRNTIYTYTYDLVGAPQPDGTLLVKYGKWTGDSVRAHPDFVQTLPDKGVKVQHWSHNKQLDPGMINDILAKTGAFKHF